MVCSIYHYKVKLGFKASPTQDWHWKIEQLKFWVFLKESSVIINIITVKTQKKSQFLILNYARSCILPVYIFVRKESVKQFAAVLYLSRCPLDISIFCTNKPCRWICIRNSDFESSNFHFLSKMVYLTGKQPYNNSQCSWCDVFGIMLMIGEWGRCVAAKNM